MKSNIPTDLREKYSEYLYDYTHDERLDSDEKVWVNDLRNESIKPWSPAEHKRSKEISDLIYNYEFAGDEWEEFYEVCPNADVVKKIKLRLPGRRETELCIYKNWLVYTQNHDEDYNKVKKGAKVPGTIHYDIADDGDVIDENYIC